MAAGPSGSIHELDLKLLMLKVVERWEKLPAGHSAEINEWLKQDMAPVINELRSVLKMNKKRLRLRRCENWPRCDCIVQGYDKDCNK